MLGKIEGERRRGWQSMKCLDGISDVMDMSLSRLWKLVMGSQRVGYNWNDLADAEYATPKYTILMCWLLWIRVIEETSGAKTLWPSFVPLKARTKSPMWKRPSLYQEARRHPYHQRQGENLGLRRTCNQTLLLLYSFTTGFLSGRYESCLLWSFLWVIFFIGLLYLWN